ncbi:hypothetical protein [Ktedonospora formicarum]|nr:hypothetical protein [Ktedonospora formicarum]
MTLAHVHLLVNHFPILGTLFIMALFIIALVFRSTLMQKVSLWFLVVIALLTAVAYATGDKAEAAVQGLPGISEQIIHLHANVARIGLILMFITGVIALWGAVFYRKHHKLPRLLLITVLIVLLLNTALFAYVGFLGGQIHHQEIRSAIEYGPALRKLL